MKRDNVRQFKLSSGEELICEIVEWDTEVSDEIVTRNMYNIIAVEGDEPGTRYYTFRPYMCLQNSESMFQTLNPYHVVATAIPTANILDQFESTVDMNETSYATLEQEIKKKIDDLKEKLNIEDDLSDDDRAEKNIIRFNPKKLH